ncbi:MAG: aminotransferase class I/II-fold pyridoxal phosphate-dependent enzyme [Anaerolineales bacterium]|nr:aminotransferase class I/II-fold pyridoxal phosphate-dependent enzyme [Anaerolineales bacterium]
MINETEHTAKQDVTILKNWPRLIYRVGRNQAKNILNLISGRSLTTPSLVSATLDQDDVTIAKKWLKDRRQWRDQSIVAQYESEFVRWNQSKHVFAFMGGRVALSACIYALGLQPGDEVILPGYTCVVVPNAFNYAGIDIVYCDIELDTYGLDITQLEKKITPKTRAILLHHLYGLVCRDFEAILNLAKRCGLKVIEDCAHATGAEYKGRKVGNFGDCAFYSSEQSKIFNTTQGGLAVTNDDDLAAKIKEYYDQAPLADDVWIDKLLHNVIINFYQFKHPGRWWLGDLTSLRYASKYQVSTTREEEEGNRPEHYGRRMPAPVAALGLNQLRKIDDYNRKRRETAKLWDQWCQNNGYTPPLVIPNSTPVYLRYPILVEPEKKQNTYWALKNPGVNIGVWFVSHTHPAIREVVGCPNADIAVKQCINFPGVIL